MPDRKHSFSHFCNKQRCRILQSLGTVGPFEKHVSSRETYPVVEDLQKFTAFIKFQRSFQEGKT